MNGQMDGQMSRQIGRWAMAWQSGSGAPQPFHREPGLAAGGVQRRDVYHIRLWAYLAPGEGAWRGLPPSPHPYSIPVPSALGPPWGPSPVQAIVTRKH